MKNLFVSIYMLINLIETNMCKNRYLAVFILLEEGEKMAIDVKVCNYFHSLLLGLYGIVHNCFRQNCFSKLEFL